MSQKNAKRARREARENLGITKAAERDQRDFEAQIAAVRARALAELDEPIGLERADRRRRLTLIALAALALGLLAVAVCGVR